MAAPHFIFEHRTNRQNGETSLHIEANASALAIIATCAVLSAAIFTTGAVMILATADGAQGLAQVIERMQEAADRAPAGQAEGLLAVQRQFSIAARPYMPLACVSSTGIAMIGLKCSKLAMIAKSSVGVKAVVVCMGTSGFCFGGVLAAYALHKYSTRNQDRARLLAPAATQGESNVEKGQA